MTSNESIFEGIPVFCAVVEQGSLSAAAQMLNHSTSYVSKTLQKLEQRLNTRLLNRTTRALNLTPDGRLYYQHCQQLMADAQQAQAFSHQLEPAGLLRISAPVSYGVNILRPLLAGYFARYPKVQLELDLVDRKVDLVREGFDLAIRVSLYIEDSSLIARKLAQTDVLTLASPEYLAMHGTPQHPSELSEHNCICYSFSRQEKTWLYQRQGEEIAVNVRSNLTTNNGEVELGYALGHLGITRIPRFIARDCIESGKLVELFSDFERPQVSVHALYASRKHQSARLRSFIDYLVEQLSV